MATVAKVLVENGKNVLPYTRDQLVYTSENKTIDQVYIKKSAHFWAKLTSTSASKWVTETGGKVATFSVSGVKAGMAYKAPCVKLTGDSTTDTNKKNALKFACADGYWLEVLAGSVKWHTPGTTPPSTSIDFYVEFYDASQFA